MAYAGVSFEKILTSVHFNQVLNQALVETREYDQELFGVTIGYFGNKKRPSKYLTDTETLGPYSFSSVEDDPEYNCPAEISLITSEIIPLIEFHTHGFNNNCFPSSQDITQYFKIKRKVNSKEAFVSPLSLIFNINKKVKNLEVLAFQERSIKTPDENYTNKLARQFESESFIENPFEIAKYINQFKNMRAEAFVFQLNLNDQEIIPLEIIKKFNRFRFNYE